MENVRVKVRESCTSVWFDIVICEGKKVLMDNTTISWRTAKGAIRNAKAMAKRIGIPFDPEIIKQKGC